MSKNTGEPGTLRHLAGQWAAQIAWSLEAIVGAILMLVSKILANTGGGRPHETQAWRMPQVPARLWWPMVSKPQAMVAARGFFVHDRRAVWGYPDAQNKGMERCGDSNGTPGALGRCLLS